MKRKQSWASCVSVGSLFLLLAACESVSEINQRQSCQLQCADALIADLDSCDAENPEGSLNHGVGSAKEKRITGTFCSNTVSKFWGVSAMRWVMNPAPKGLSVCERM